MPQIKAYSTEHRDTISKRNIGKGAPTSWNTGLIVCKWKEYGLTANCSPSGTLWNIFISAIFISAISQNDKQIAKD